MRLTKDALGEMFSVRMCKALENRRCVPLPRLLYKTNADNLDNYSVEEPLGFSPTKLSGRHFSVIKQESPTLLQW